MGDSLHQTVNELSEVIQEIKEQVITLQGQNNILHSILRRLILINTPEEADQSVWDS